ncbi:hypothetical protein ACJX0J_006607 [Zea mays]
MKVEKETHVTAKCFAKNAAKKPRKSFLGLVKVIEGEIRLHTIWVVAENAICEIGSTIGAIEEIDLNSLESKDMNIDAEGLGKRASVDVQRSGKFAKNEDMVTSDKTGKMTEVIKESGEKEGFEGDERMMRISNIVPEVNLNITETEKEIEISDSIDKMVQGLLDSESEKEKMLVYNKKEDLRREKKFSLRNKKKNNSPKTPDLLTLLEFDQSQDISENNPTFEKLDRFLVNSDWDLIGLDRSLKKKIPHEFRPKFKDILEVRIILIFGKKKLDIKNEIHSLLDNGRLVENEDEINKNFLTAPFSLEEIYKNFFRISGILLKRIFGICVMIFIKVLWTSKDLIMTNLSIECFENQFGFIVLLLFMKLFMKFWRQMGTRKKTDCWFIVLFGKKEISMEWQALILEMDILLDMPSWTLDKKGFSKTILVYLEGENPTENKSFSLCSGLYGRLGMIVGPYQKHVGIVRVLMLESGVIQNMYGWLASIPFLLESYIHILQVFSIQILVFSIQTFGMPHRGRRYGHWTQEREREADY